MTQETLRDYYTMIVEAWQMLKPHLMELPKTEEDWDKLINDGRSFSDKHKDHRDFADSLAVAIIDEVERETKK